jgi:hypothetical protein
MRIIEGEPIQQGKLASSASLYSIEILLVVHFLVSRKPCTYQVSVAPEVRIDT